MSQVFFLFFSWTKLVLFSYWRCHLFPLTHLSNSLVKAWQKPTQGNQLCSFAKKDNLILFLCWGIRDFLLQPEPGGFAILLRFLPWFSHTWIFFSLRCWEGWHLPTPTPPCLSLFKWYSTENINKSSSSSIVARTVENRVLVHLGLNKNYSSEGYKWSDYRPHLWVLLLLSDHAL
jgi:hypothetical protein